MFFKNSYSAFFHSNIKYNLCAVSLFKGFVPNLYTKNILDVIYMFEVMC